MTNIDRTFRAQLEQEKVEEGDMKVTEEFINGLRALAKRQKAESKADEFAKILGNEGKDIPKPTPQEAQINIIAEGLEIEEE